MKPARYPSIYAKSKPESREELIDTHQLSAGTFKESGGYPFLPILDLLFCPINKMAHGLDLFSQGIAGYLVELMSAHRPDDVVHYPEDALYSIFDAEEFESGIRYILPLSSQNRKRSALQISPSYIFIP
jgi:hypothetical protein